MLSRIASQHSPVINKDMITNTHRLLLLNTEQAATLVFNRLHRIVVVFITCRPAWNDNKYHSTKASMRASGVGPSVILTTQSATAEHQ